MVKEGELLWTPSPERIANSNLLAYERWLEKNYALKFKDYPALWQWSVTEIEAFWESMWQYFGIESSAPYECVLRSRKMPGAQWFPGARINYAQHVMRQEKPGKDALLYRDEISPLKSMSWPEMANKVRVLATELRRMGVKRGDRVVAYLPNTPHAVIAMLATTSIGAIWASCGPDFGARGALDRYSQLAPKVIFCVDGYVYGDKRFSRKAELKEILKELTSLEKVIYVPHLNPQDHELPSDKAILWDEVLAKPPVPAAAFEYEQVPFEHPLWILFSSGTTGLPKPIVHCHGGILIEQMKLSQIHMDLHPGDRMFFYTTTGWMMWNFLVSSLLSGVTPILYDGSPVHPEPGVLWKMVEEAKVNFFGGSPGYQQMLAKAGIIPKDQYDLTSLRSMMLAGSPVTAECMAWFFENAKRDMYIQSGSGGTDVCSGFNGGVPNMPLYAGEIQFASLGIAAYAFNDRGESVVDEVGELVITQPMPSMPVGFWNDRDNQRYLESYFQEYPGIWRHGDFYKVNQRGGCFVLGRSDATLNRHGVRIGTAEIYRSLQEVTEVEDSLIINLDLPGGNFFMPLFVKLNAGLQLNKEIEDKIKKQIRATYSPRHVPDKVYQVPDIPYTLTGKKMEVPVRRVLMGTPVTKAANLAAVANPQALDYFIEYAKNQQDYKLG